MLSFSQKKQIVYTDICIRELQAYKTQLKKEYYHTTKRIVKLSLKKYSMIAKMKMRKNNILHFVAQVSFTLFHQLGAL